MLRELIEYSKSIKEKVRATLNEIKKNPQATNNEGKEAKVQINNLEHKEAKNNHVEQEENRIQKQ